MSNTRSNVRNKIATDISTRTVEGVQRFYPPVFDGSGDVGGATSGLPLSEKLGAIAFSGSVPSPGVPSLHYYSSAGWIAFGENNRPNNPVLTSLGVGTSLVSQSVGPDLKVKTFRAGDGIVLSTGGGGEITISSPTITFTSAGGGDGETLIATPTPTITLKSIVAGTNVEITTTPTTITIGYIGPPITDDPGTLASVGDGLRLTNEIGATPEEGPNFTLKAIRSNSARLAINDLGNGTVELEQISDAITLGWVGTGLALVPTSSVNPDFLVKTIAGTPGKILVTTTGGGNDLTISSAMTLSTATPIPGNSFSLVDPSTTTTNFRIKRLAFGPGVVVTGNQIYPTRFGKVIGDLGLTYTSTLTFITNAPIVQQMRLTYVTGVGPNGTGTSLYITIDNGTIVAPFFCRPLALDFTFGPDLTVGTDRILQVDYLSSPDLSSNLDPASFFMPPHFSYIGLPIAGGSPLYTGQGLPVISRTEIGKTRQRIYLEPMATSGFEFSAAGAFRW